MTARLAPLFETCGAEQHIITRSGANRDQDACGGRERRLHAGVQNGEVRHYIGHEEDDEADDQGDENGGIEKRNEKFLAHRKAELLISQVAFENFDKRSAFLAGKD